MTTAMIVKGMAFRNGDGEQQKLVVRFTSDEFGETFSISNDKDLMLLSKMSEIPTGSERSSEW